jgi:hypothetical protein
VAAGERWDSLAIGVTLRASLFIEPKPEHREISLHRWR